MSQKGKNGNILTFFKPVSQASPQSSPQRTPQKQSSQHPLATGSLPQLTSSPLALRSSPIKPYTSPVPEEIGASDEDNGFSSDSSFAELDELLGRPGHPKPPQRTTPSKTSSDLFDSPSAKRTAVELNPSPLSALPKHKFDLKALTKDAKQDDMTNESSLRNKAFHEELESRASKGTESAIVEIVKQKGGQDAHKVLRAVQRADNGASQPCYCFFDRSPQAPVAEVPPKGLNKSPWRLLANGNIKTRERHLVSGVPYTMLTQTGGLPDELFEWMLTEICTSVSVLIRDECSNLVASSIEQVHRLLTPEKLQDLFLKVGADQRLKDETFGLLSLKPGDEAYEAREWGCLRSLLVLLSMIAPELPTRTIEFATRSLIRMSMDKVVIANIDVLIDYEAAVSSLLESLPSSRWNTLCFEICSSLHQNIKPQHIRVNSLLCLPIHSSSSHDLRRRLAVAFLFDDPGLSRTHSEEVITMRRLIDRLGKDDFRITPKTDFTELKAGIVLLDVALDDGSCHSVADPVDDKRFNEEVDELANKLRELWRSINDSGMKLARTEAKAVIEWVQQRLSHSVRTKRRAKKSVFDIPAQKEDHTLPQQQDYMKRFLKNVRPGEL